MRRAAILIIFCASLCGCFVWAAGKDPAGAKLQAQSEQVAAGLNAYRAKYGALPERLDLLVPEFIPALPSPSIRYDRSRASLAFNYSPSWPQSGQAFCSTGIEHISWHCAGYL